MSALLAAGDHVGAIATLRASKAPNQRMINMAFSAAVDGCGGAAALPVESWVSRAARSAAQGAEARRMAATLGDGVEVRPSEAAGV